MPRRSYRYWFHRERDDAARTLTGWRGEGTSPNASPLVCMGRADALIVAQREADKTGETIVVKRQAGLLPSEPVARKLPARHSCCRAFVRAGHDFDCPNR
jgi:hypothetical protein